MEILTDPKIFQFHREELLPNIISREQMVTLLGSIREGRFRALFTLMHHCGLRLSECTHLKPGHIDGERGVVRVVNGKGGKSREVPVSEELLIRLRRYWKAHRNEEWLFPGVGQGWTPKRCSLAEAMHGSDHPISVSSVQNALKAIVLSLGWEAKGGRRPITCHTLRHCYGTYLLEAGVSIRLVSQYLGHASLKPTLAYLHLTEVSVSKAREVLAKLPGV
jgi:integrase